MDDDPVETLLLEAEEALQAGKPERALEVLRAAVEIYPDEGDIHHALALAYEEVDDERSMVRHFVQTRILDARADRENGIGSESDLELILETAEECIAELPAQFRDLLAGVPVMIEPRPSIHLVREGFDPRAFGLFEGPDNVERSHVEAPTRIVLYTSNLLASFADEDELIEQVRITVLHEIAHYFGFEEEEMERLGLE